MLIINEIIKVEEFSGKRTVEALEAFVEKHRTKKDEL